jgi:SAM-dependent methyltransferase
MTSENLIRAAQQPRCALCGQLGKLLHTGLKDSLFGAPGTWRLVRCPDRQCGLIWMDPMPLAEDLGRAYQGYYTHAAPSEAGAGNLLRRAYSAIKSDYLVVRYGYPSVTQHSLSGRLGWLLYLLPLQRAGVESEARYLRACPRGRLLDVGCGGGKWLTKMRDLGWEVRGVDFDAEAVKAAARRGLRVDHGSLEAVGYPGGSFDAITLNHVIEHLPDPVSTLEECRRLLKPGGHLVVVTPNSASLGHWLFKGAWRGLEPPRHLRLFCPSSMRVALKRAGFSHFEVRTVNSDDVLMRSLALWAGLAEPGGRLPMRLRAASLPLAMLEQALLVVHPEAGECLVVQALKP